MNSKTAKKLRKISLVYGVSIKDVERSYKIYGPAYIKKYEDRGGLENYGKIKKEIKKIKIKSHSEIMGEIENDKLTKEKLVNAKKTLEGTNAKDTNSRATSSN